MRFTGGGKVVTEHILQQLVAMTTHGSLHLKGYAAMGSRDDAVKEDYVDYKESESHFIVDMSARRA